ncbi:MAG: hypothetical protein ACI81W_003801, partial [Saprospiraceae bacterium]
MQRLYIGNRYQNKPEKANAPKMGYNNRFMNNIYTLNQLKYSKTKTLRKFLFLIGIFLLFQSSLFSQAHLQLTVQDGLATTTCTDIFGAPDPLFSVSVNGNPYVTYPGNQFCFTDFPNMQYDTFYNCPVDVASLVNLCFRVFEDDGFFCNLNEQCLVEY